MGLLDAMRCRDEVYENRSPTSAAGSASPASPTRTAPIRFGTDPATSALDLDCKLHDLDNLYVADSSFFVSSDRGEPDPDDHRQRAARIRDNRPAAGTQHAGRTAAGARAAGSHDIGRLIRSRRLLRFDRCVRQLIELNRHEPRCAHR